MTVSISSSAFKPNARIPKRHSGDGEDVSPALAWSNLPAGTKSVTLICDDPDAPTSQPWVHWVVYNLPADLSGLPEGVSRTPALQQYGNARQGLNSWGSNNLGYRGPAPPPGHGTHHYHFRLYALDTTLDLEPGAARDTVDKAMEGHILAGGEVIGTYER